MRVRTSHVAPLYVGDYNIIFGSVRKIMTLFFVYFLVKVILSAMAEALQESVTFEGLERSDYAAAVPNVDNITTCA